MRKLRFIVLLLVAVLLFTGCENLMEMLVAEMMDVDPQQLNQTFSQMTYTRPDMDELQILADEAAQIALTDASAEEIMEKVYAYYDAYDLFGTMYCLAELRYSMDLTNQYYQKEYEYCGSQISYVDSTLEDLYVELAKSPVVDELEKEYFAEDFFAPYQAPEGSDEDWEYDSVWDETYTELYNRENAIIGKYYVAQDELSTLDPESPSYLDRCLNKLAPIYLELIQVRQEIAQYSGFTSYEEYVNSWYYNRELRHDELEDYAAIIQQELVPLYRQYCTPDRWDWATGKKATEEDCLRYVQSAAEHMGGTLSDAYDEMVRRELYDLHPSANKAAGSYETYLTSFAAPFILVNPMGDMSDLLTFAHEFGHFANDYAVYGTYTSADVAEVLSQSMEYLSLSYADALSEEDMAQLRHLSMCNALETYVLQMAFYSFEQEVYKLTGDQLTEENITACFAKVIQDYGLDTSDAVPEEWVTVPHFFQAPFYVFSYVVSCDAAMQIYQLELETPGEGLSLFEEFLYEWEDLPLSDYRQIYDLQDPLLPQRVESVAQTLSTILAETQE